MNDLKIDVIGDKLIVRPEGELDHHYAAEIRDKLDAAIHRGGIRRVIFDFSRV